MVRRIAFRNSRRPPIPDREGNIDRMEEHKYQRQTADDLRRDLVEVSNSTPDLRDRVSFISEGPGIVQRVAHKMPFKPEFFMVVKAQHDGDEPCHVWETRSADSRYLYLKSTAPKGAKISLVLIAGS